MAPEIFIVVAVLLLAGIGITLYKFTKYALITITATIFILGIIITVLALLVFNDTTSFIQDLESGKKVFLLDQEESIITGFGTNNEEIILLKKMYGTMSDEVAEELLQDYNLVFVMDDELFSREDIVHVDDRTDITGEQAFTILNSDTPKETFFEIIGERRENNATDEDLKAYIFIALIRSSAIIAQPTMLLDYVRSGMVEVYPETITFKIIKFLPSFIIEGVV